MEIVELDINGNYIREFISIREISRTYSIHPSTIGIAIKNKKIIHNRFKFIKKDDYYNNKTIENNE